MSLSTGEAGVKRGTNKGGPPKGGPLVSKAFLAGQVIPEPAPGQRPTIYQYEGENPGLIGVSGPAERPASTKGQRKALKEKRDRQQQQREAFPDAAAFAYFKKWRLEHRITVTFPKCRRCCPVAMDSPGFDDWALVQSLLHEFRRVLRKAGYPFACIWSRSDGEIHGLHVHLGLYFPLSDEVLIQILERITGSPRRPRKRVKGVIAQSVDDGWQIKRNIMTEIPSAMRWTNYLLGQDPMPGSLIAGKLLGVSSALSAKAVEAERGALEAWKAKVGWRTEWAF